MPPRSSVDNVLGGGGASGAGGVAGSSSSGGGWRERDPLETSSDMRGSVTGDVGDAFSLEQERGGESFTPGVSPSLREELSSLIVWPLMSSWLLRVVGDEGVMGSGGSAI